MNEMAVIEHQAGNLPPSGSLSLILKKGLPFEQWIEIGQELAAREKVLNWWIGDWWAFGEHEYGARAKAAAEGVFGLAFQTLVNAGSVSRKFGGNRRRLVLSWSHHAEVAALPPAEADALLDRAEAEGMTKGEVRVEALKRKVHLGIVRPRDVDDDWNYKALKAIAAAWNRAERSVREEFAGLVAESEFGVIEV